MKLAQIMQIMEGIAPLELAQPWDNPGLACGDPNMDIHGIFCALDASGAAIERARELGANLIVTHHPINFAPIKSLAETGYQGKLLSHMIRLGMACYSAHTNLDDAAGGVSDCLAKALGLNNPGRAGNGVVGELQPTSPRNFFDHVEACLGARVQFYECEGTRVQRAYVIGGNGGEFFAEAAQCGAQALVTGEMHHDEILEALDLGLNVYVVGHHFSERVVLQPLSMRLKEATGLPVEYDGDVRMMGRIR